MMDIEKNMPIVPISEIYDKLFDKLNDDIRECAEIPDFDLRIREKVPIEDIRNKATLFWHIAKLNEKIKGLKNELAELEKRDIEKVPDEAFIKELEKRGFKKYLPPIKKNNVRLIEMD